MRKIEAFSTEKRIISRQPPLRNRPQPIDRLAFIEPLEANRRLNGLGAIVWHEEPTQQSAWFARGAGCWPRELSGDPRVCRSFTCSVKIAAARLSRPAANRRSRRLPAGTRRDREPRAGSSVSAPGSSCLRVVSLVALACATGRLQQLPQPGVSGLADWQLRPVGQDRDAAVAHPHLDFRQSGQIQDVPSMDPHERGRVQQRLQLAERLFLEIAPPSAT